MTVHEDYIEVLVELLELVDSFFSVGSDVDCAAELLEMQYCNLLVDCIVFSQQDVVLEDGPVAVFGGCLSNSITEVLKKNVNDSTEQ